MAYIFNIYGIIFSKYTRHDPKKQIVSKYNCSHYLINEAGKHIIILTKKVLGLKFPKKIIKI